MAEGHGHPLVDLNSTIHPNIYTNDLHVDFVWMFTDIHTAELERFITDTNTPKFSLCFVSRKRMFMMQSYSTRYESHIIEDCTEANIHGLRPVRGKYPVREVRNCWFHLLKIKLDLGLESEPSSQFLKEMEPNQNQDSIL